jgi:hypothetical protein
MMTVGTLYRRGDRHVYRHVAGEHMLVAIHRDTIAPLFSLTATAAAIWQALAEWTSVDALADAVTRDFEVGREQAAADVAEFLEQLRQIGALVEREAEA